MNESDCRQSPGTSRDFLYFQLPFWYNNQKGGAFMLTKNTDKKREQIQMFCMDDELIYIIYGENITPELIREQIEVR